MPLLPGSPTTLYQVLNIKNSHRNNRYMMDHYWALAHPFTMGIFSLIFHFVPFIDGTYLKNFSPNIFVAKVSIHPCLPIVPAWPMAPHQSPTRNAQHNKQHNTTSIPCHPILPHQSLPMPI